MCAQYDLLYDSLQSFLLYDFGYDDYWCRLLLYLNETQAELWRKLKLMKSVDNVRTLCYDMFIFCSKVIELNNWIDIAISLQCCCFLRRVLFRLRRCWWRIESRQWRRHPWLMDILVVTRLAHIGRRQDGEYKQNIRWNRTY